MPYRLSSWLTVWILEILLILVLNKEVLGGRSTYINKFAVHIPGGPDVAREVADLHGYHFHGQVNLIKLEVEVDSLLSVSNQSFSILG